MAFDPFNDYETRGYLQNHAGSKNSDIVKRLEHNAFSGNVLRALDMLRNAPEINLETVRDTHRILFSDVYPWAGQDRSENAFDLNVTKGEVDFQMAPYVPRGVEHALSSAANLEQFRNNPGKAIGELAYAHPFLDGNGRTITTLVSELSRRAGFHIAWEETDKQGYLTALTKELDDPKHGYLTAYLKPFVREGVLGIEQSASLLATLPGLSAPDQSVTGQAQSQPTLTIVAGANGAGKSSMTATGLFENAQIIDPDAIARAINPENPQEASTTAGKRALDLRNEFLNKRVSFVVETTLSGHSALNLIDEAKALGFKVDLKFIGLENVDLAKARVAARVQTGGHDVPDQDIERRFSRSLENLPEAIRKSDHTEIFENSNRDPQKVVADLERDGFAFHEPPVWATNAAFEAAQKDLSHAQTVTELERSTERAFEAARAGGVSEEHLKQELKNLERTQDKSKSREGHDL